MQIPALPRQVAILTVSLAVLTACASRPPQDEYNPGERIGTYDGRAVAIAYANSERFADWMKEFRVKHTKAKAAGEDATVKAIETTMERQQETFHGQAFRGENIDDILARIPDHVRRIRSAADVVRLEQVNLRRPTTIETIDVTDQLVAVFEPDAKARGWIRDIRKKPLARRR